MSAGSKRPALPAALTSTFRTAAETILVLAVMLVAFTLAAGADPGNEVYSADYVHPFMVVADVLRDPMALFTWYHSPALYVIPDWIIAGALIVAGVPAQAQPVVYGGLMLAAWAAGTGALFARAHGLRPRTPILLATLSLGCLFVLLALFPVEQDGRRSWLFLAYVYCHGGAALASFVGAVLLLRIHDGRRSGLALAGLFAIVVGLSLSDALFLAWFTAPVFGVLALRSWTDRRRKPLLLGLTILAASVGVYAFVQSVKPTDGYFGSSDTLTSITGFGGRLARLAAAGDWVSLAVCAVCLGLVFRAARLTIAALKRRPLDRLEWLELGLGASAAGTVLAPLATGPMDGDWPWRYLYMLYPLAAFGLALQLGRVASSLKHAARFALAGIAVLAVVAAMPAHTAALRMTHFDLVACLDEEGRTTGYGGYWTAKPGMFMSNSRIHIVQGYPNGDWDRWNYNGAWFARRADTRAVAYPDFVLNAGLYDDELLESFGVPDRIRTCGGNQIWLYDHPIYGDIWLSAHVRKHVDADSAIAATAYVAAIGQPAADGSVENHPGAGRDVLTYGPYASLLPGRYRVTFDYEADAEQAFDLLRAAERRRFGVVRLTSGVLPPTAGSRARHSIEIDLPDGANRFEARTWYSGTGMLRVYRYWIERVGE